MVTYRSTQTRSHWCTTHVTPSANMQQGRAPGVSSRECQANTGQITEMTLKQQQKMFYHTVFVDQNHKILACLPPKSGSSTWKAILANNSQDKPLPSNIDTKKMFTSLRRSKILTLSKFNSSMQQYFLKHTEYFKFMIARHPFERLYSGYVDKLVSHRGIRIMEKHGRRILDMFHPELDAETRKIGFGATFYEFVQYLMLPGSSKSKKKMIINIKKNFATMEENILTQKTFLKTVMKFVPRGLYKHFGNFVYTRRNLFSIWRKLILEQKERSFGQEGNYFEWEEHSFEHKKNSEHEKLSSKQVFLWIGRNTFSIMFVEESVCMDRRKKFIMNKHFFRIYKKKSTLNNIKNKQKNTSQFFWAGRKFFQTKMNK